MISRKCCLGLCLQEGLICNLAAEDLAHTDMCIGKCTVFMLISKQNLKEIFTIISVEYAIKIVPVGALVFS